LNPAARGAGFTLVEILVAFVVIGVLGAAMLQLFQGSLRNVALSAEYTEAALLARSKLAEFEAREALQAGVEQGETGLGYRWRAELSPLATVDPEGAITETAPESPVEALRLTLTLSWGGEGDARDYVVETVLLTALQPDLPR
jgi:general secretion pathway protein I